MDRTGTVRLDKWLWAVRLFKTRTLAAEACRRGKVRLDQRTLRPAYSLKDGDTISVSKDRLVRTVRVARLIARRVSAGEAVACYEDLTPAEEYARLKAEGALARGSGRGRPTKRERRQVDDLLGGLREMGYASPDESPDGDTPV